MSETPSYPALIQLISRLEGKDKAVAAKALYCLNKLDEKESKLFNEVQSLREDNKRFYKQAEMNARLMTENTSLRAENEKLRRDVKTAVMGDSAELADVKRENEKLRAAFRVNMLRAFPHTSHDEIDAEIEAAIRESGDE